MFLIRYVGALLVQEPLTSFWDYSLETFRGLSAG